MKEMKYLLVLVLVFMGCNSYNPSENIEKLYRENKSNRELKKFYGWHFNRRDYNSKKVFLVDNSGPGFYLCKYNDDIYELPIDIYQQFIETEGKEFTDGFIKQANIMLKIINIYDIYHVYSLDTLSIYFDFYKKDILVFSKLTGNELNLHIKKKFPNYFLYKKFDENWIWIKENEKK